MSNEDVDYRGGEQVAGGARTLSDAIKRDAYKRQIEGIAREGVEKVRAAREGLDMDAARQAAREAFDARNAARAATQDELSWTGRQFSKAVERPRDWGKMLVDTERKVLQANPALRSNPAATEYEVYESIAESAGRSNMTMGPVQYASKALGGIAIALGAALILKHVWDAPPGQKWNTLGRELAGAGVGLASSALGSTLAIWALKALIPAVGAGGLMVAGLVGGIGLALLADYAYRSLGRRLGGDPIYMLLGALLGLVIGVAAAADAGAPPVSPLDCDCSRVEFGLLTKEFQEDCRNSEAALKAATAGCGANERCIADKLKLKAGPDGRWQSGSFCSSNSGPYAWPVSGGPVEVPARPPAPKPCKQVSGLARTCQDQ